MRLSDENMTQLKSLRKQWKSSKLTYFIIEVNFQGKRELQINAGKSLTNPISYEQMFYCELRYFHINGKLSSVKMFIICTML